MFGSGKFKLGDSLFSAARLTALLLCTTIILSINAGFAKTPPKADKKGVGTWGTARQLVEPNNMPPAPGLTNNTYARWYAYQ